MYICGKWSFHGENSSESYTRQFFSQCRHGKGMFTSMKYIIEAEWRIYASVNYPSLVEIMACRLDGHLEMSSGNVRPFCLGLNVLKRKRQDYVYWKKIMDGYKALFETWNKANKQRARYHYTAQFQELCKYVLCPFCSTFCPGEMS